VGVTGAAPGRHEFRVRPDGLAVVRDGAVEISGCDADVGAARVESRVARIEPDHLVKSAIARSYSPRAPEAVPRLQ
jgi:hypothetical protein